MSNREAARLLFGVAALLESEGANVYRLRAYRRAACSLLALPAEASVYLNTSRELQLPWLGQRLRRKLGELVSEGRMQFYDDLVAALPPVKRQLLAIPGVGPITARRLEEELHLESAEAVAEAAAAGRLRQLRSIGKVREQRLGQAASAMLREAA
ncbi:MAG TPA: helix-hairpin-helix domain-containing protein [Chloroflexota bacterium]|nr:helix-hairpin-helix domain-containing protein [Chloroflexota bacterium]